MSVYLNTLYITSPDAYLRLEGETVCVMIEKEKRLQVPLHHPGGFVLFGHTMMSPGLMAVVLTTGALLFGQAAMAIFVLCRVPFLRSCGLFTACEGQYWLVMPG